MRQIFICRRFIFLLLAAYTNCYSGDEQGFLVLVTSIVTGEYIAKCIKVLKVDSSGDVTFEAMKQDASRVLEQPKICDDTWIKGIAASFTDSAGHWKLDDDLGGKLSEKINEQVSDKFNIMLSEVLDASNERYKLIAATKDEESKIKAGNRYNEFLLKLNRQSSERQQQIPPRYSMEPLFAGINYYTCHVMEGFLGSLQSLTLDQYQREEGNAFIRNCFEFIPKEDPANVILKEDPPPPSYYEATSGSPPSYL